MHFVPYRLLRILRSRFRSLVRLMSQAIKKILIDRFTIVERMPCRFNLRNQTGQVLRRLVRVIHVAQAGLQWAEHRPKDFLQSNAARQQR